MAIQLKTLQRLIRAKVRKAGGVRAMGLEYGIQPSKISEALKDGAEPQPHVAAALGYRKARAMYEKVTP